MRLNKIVLVCFLSCLGLMPLAIQAAPVFSVDITFDENGNGQLMSTGAAPLPLPFAVAPDPGPGGLPAALTYDLLNPPGLVPGDVILLEPPTLASFSDIIRFNPGSFVPGRAGSVVFYSDSIGGADALADVAVPPSALYPNNVAFVEVGPEGANGFDYTPTPGQPGFVTGAAGPVTYHIISDGIAPFVAVPLPNSAIGGLVLLSFFAVYRFQLHRRRCAQ